MNTKTNPGVTIPYHVTRSYPTQEIAETALKTLQDHVSFHNVNGSIKPMTYIFPEGTDYVLEVSYDWRPTRYTNGDISAIV